MEKTHQAIWGTPFYFRQTKRWSAHNKYCIHGRILQICNQILQISNQILKAFKSESDVTYGQVWWPILGICALHLTHPKCIHTAVNTHKPWTHTRSSGQPLMLRHPGSSWGFGALLKGTSVVVLRVERALYIHSPHLQFLPARDSNPQPLGYEPDSLTIRPWLPLSEIKLKT